MTWLRWLLAVILTVLLAAFATAAVTRPYADNQRNWLVIGALLSGVSLGAVFLARPFVAGVMTGARAVVNEWKPRE